MSQFDSDSQALDWFDSIIDSNQIFSLNSANIDLIHILYKYDDLCKIKSTVNISLQMVN